MPNYLGSKKEFETSLDIGNKDIVNQSSFMMMNRALNIAELC